MDFMFDPNQTESGLTTSFYPESDALGATYLISRMPLISSLQYLVYSPMPRKLIHTTASLDAAKLYVDQHIQHIEMKDVKTSLSSWVDGDGWCVGPVAAGEKDDNRWRLEPIDDYFS